MDDAASNNDQDTWHDEDFLSLETSNDDEKKETTNVGDRSTNTSRSGAAAGAAARGESSNQLSSSSTSSGTTSHILPPWVDQPNDYRRMHPLIALHNEIVSFTRLMEPLPAEMCQREDLINQIKELVQRAFGGTATVDVFGSFATGLLLPTSDIDLVVYSKQQAETTTTEKQETGGGAVTAAAASLSNDEDKEEDWDENTAGSPIHRFAAALRDEWISELSYLEVIENTRVPLVKFTYAPTNISVDVCFNQMTGPPAATLMKTYMEALPPLRPLTFVLKYFLAARGLNEPYSGGVGSFMLQLMIVSFLQHRERYSYNHGRASVYNLGSLLLDFFVMYGLDFNYSTTGISVRNDGSFFPKGAPERKATFCTAGRPNLMALENPLDPTMDVGKSSFRIQMIQRACATASRIILSHCSIPYEPAPSILGTILPVNQEMLDRQVLKRRDRPLEAKRKSRGDTPPRGGNNNKRSRWR